MKKNKLDIFYSVFSIKISPLYHQIWRITTKLKIFSDFIEDNVYKRKLLNIFKLFLDKSKYNKSEINFKKVVIIQFIYSPLYDDDQNINLYIPGNYLKKCQIYIIYSKIKNYLLSNPYYHYAYVCICNKHKDNEDLKEILKEKEKRNCIILDSFFKKTNKKSKSESF